ncbi:MAG: DUF6044 family protein [Muribaculum sp.]|nr:DUF6044 family protein [Muribaculum sp.]
MRKGGKVLFAAGFAAVLLLAAPGLLLGKNAVITYHDQLDGELIAYLLQARHLWDGGGLPEFLGGAAKTALIPPAPACVLLFLGGNALGAFWVMRIVGSLVGYVGMYLLARHVTGRELPAVLAAGMYAALPFLPVYGLSQYGLPMLLWCAVRVREGGRMAGPLLYTVCFALNSSLVLVGFAVLLVMAAAAVCGMPMLRKRRPDADKNRENGSGSLRLWGMWAVLAAGYLLTNLSLIGQMLGLGGAALSHKSEYALSAEPFWESWARGFLYGGQHSQDAHLGILAAAIVAVAVSCAFRGRIRGIGWGICRLIRRKVEDKDRDKDRDQEREGMSPEPFPDQERKLVRVILAALCVNLGLSGVSALWNAKAGIALRSGLGALGAFQMDRLLWLAPCLWYLILACTAALALELLKGRRNLWKLRAGVCLAVIAAAVCAGGWQILKNSDTKANVQKLRNADYPAMSYADYYAIGVLEQVEDFLGEYTGLPQSAYRVVSLGMDPAAALYHGFYCLDGYSNNYDLAYKHRFREVIAPALEESDYLRAYYDEWGNRCYLFGSECPGYYTIEKNGFYFAHLELDTAALRELGGRYLFSAAYVANAEDLGLVLLREEPFETAESYYRIFLYEVGTPG